MFNFFKSAHEAFEAGEYVRAVALYERAIAERPALAAVYGFNLSRAKDRLAKMDVALRKVTPLAVVANVNTISLDDLYKEVSQAATKFPVDAKVKPPLVSVVMTAHNVQAYIEQAVTSVLRQTHKPLEVIVVDDGSTDDTWRILQRLSREYPVIVRRLNANLGTYFAKNVGVQLAQGEFVFFQDGDDLCHPERIRLCLQVLMQPGTACVQGSYSRVVFPQGRVLPVNGLVKKLGLITLGVRRAVFEDIGYFNCTTKASDDEFFQRLRQFYQNRPMAVRTLDVPLNYNTLREVSSFADMIANDPVVDGCIEQVPSPVRQTYVNAFQALHSETASERFRSLFHFPRIRDVIPVPAEMSRLANPALSVVASLCSIPERRELLRQTLASLRPQVDEIHLYLDRYAEVPDFVQESSPNITVRLSRDFPGLRDNGKFVPLLGREEPCYFFTADDDIHYPPDYVNALVKKIEHYGRLAVVGVHGVLIPENPTGYFSGFRRVHWFIRELEQDRLVNNLGTGTVAFHSGRLKGLDYRHFSHSGMADLYLATFCKARGIPMVAVARPENWLIQLETPTDGPTASKSLFAEGSQIDEKQSRLVRQHVPWGYGGITEAVEAAARQPGAQEPGARLRALLPLLPQCLW